MYVSLRGAIVLHVVTKNPGSEWMAAFSHGCTRRACGPLGIHSGTGESLDL